MKILACTVYCSASYQSSLQLPEEIEELSEAIRYAEEHLDEIPLGILQYIPDSDELSEVGGEILELDETKAAETFPQTENCRNVCAPVSSPESARG